MCSASWIPPTVTCLACTAGWLLIWLLSGKVLLIWKICKRALHTLEFLGVFLPVMIILQAQNTQAGGTVHASDVLPRKVRISLEFSSSHVVYGSRNRRTIYLKAELNGICIHHHHHITVIYLFTYLFIKRKVINDLRLLSLATGQLVYQINENMGERKQYVGCLYLYMSVIFCYLLYIATVSLYLILVCDFCS